MPDDNDLIAAADELGSALTSALITQERANVADGLFAIARALNLVAEQINDLSESVATLKKRS
jgi:hypothetical protein